MDWKKLGEFRMLSVNASVTGSVAVADWNCSDDGKITSVTVSGTNITKDSKSYTGPVWINPGFKPGENATATNGSVSKTFTNLSGFPSGSHTVKLRIGGDIGKLVDTYVFKIYENLT